MLDAEKWIEQEVFPLPGATPEQAAEIHAMFEVRYTHINRICNLAMMYRHWCMYGAPVVTQMRERLNKA